MGKYLKEFELTSQYEEYINSTMALLPNVSLTNDDNMIHYNLVSNYNYEDEYFTIENVDSHDGTLQIDINDKYHTSIENLSYNIDNSGWNDILSDSIITVTVPAGKTIQFKCDFIATGDSSSVLALKIYKNIDFNYNVYGNIMSLIEGDNFKSASKDLNEYGWGIFGSFFCNDSHIVSAKNLILPATTLSYQCYFGMFASCTSLTTAPELPATTLLSGCYQSMFSGCTSLNNIEMLATDISAYGCLSGWVTNVASTGTFVKHHNMTHLTTGTSGIPEGWEVKNHITLTECTNLTITAEDVIGNDTITIIHYTAICNGIDYKGNPVTGIIEEGTAFSAPFPQNTSETETVERTITFEFMGTTASTTITQGVWENRSYTVDLNNQWELSSTISNPNSTLYDGVYQSFSNKGLSSSAALMYIDITGYTSFKFYVRSNAESKYDYVVVSNLDSTLTSETTSGAAVKMTTSGNQNSGTSIGDYTLVEFTGIDENTHRITVMYRKDSGFNSGDDRGYVLIPKN